MRPPLVAGILVVTVLAGFLLYNNFFSNDDTRLLQKLNDTIEAFLAENPLESTPEEIPASQYHIWVLRSRRGLPAKLVPEDGYRFSYSFLAGEDVEVGPGECMNLTGIEAASCMRFAFGGLSTNDQQEIDAIVRSAEIRDVGDARNLMSALITLNGGEFYMNQTTHFLCSEVARIEEEHPPSDICEWLFHSSLNNLCISGELGSLNQIYEIKNFKPQSFRDLYCLDSVAKMIESSEAT